MKKTAIAVLFICVLSNALHAQNEPIFSTPSPSALGYGIFGEFHEPSAIGIPSIEIPIYTLKYRGITMPISLNYNVNLVKPDLHPGWTGLGWNLNASGEITRVVNDKPDDLSWFDCQTHQFTNEENVGYFYNHNYLAGSNWSDAGQIQNATTDWANYPDYFKGLSTGSSVKDYKPDEFDFSFLGYSGSFYLDENGHWKIRCEQGLKFKVNDTQISDFLTPEFDNTRSFGKFTIIDNNGIQYVFGGYTAAIEYTYNLMRYDYALPYPKSWYLTAVVLPDGDSITFNYERGQTSFTAISSYFSSNSRVGIQHEGSVIVTSYLKSITTKQATITFQRSNSTELPYAGHVFDTDYNRWSAAYNAWLNLFSTGAQVYTYDQWFDPEFMKMPLRSGGWGDRLNATNWVKLDEIDVSDHSNIRYKYQFNYTNSTAERLKLLNLVQVSPDGLQTGPRYSFTYNANIMLPPYLSNHNDHWGYYNGKNIDVTNLITFSATREPDPAFAQAEVLNKVTYPTGGKTGYVYGGHDYSLNVDAQNRTNPLNVVSPAAIAGGLRISQIVNYDSNDNITNSINFFYDKDHFLSTGSHQSTGILGGNVSYNFITSGNDVANIGLLTSYPLSHNNNGSHIAYSEVTEQYADGGYKILDFSNFDTNMDENPVAQLGTSQTLNENFSSHATDRGRLLRDRTYSSGGGLLLDHALTYSTVGNPEFVRSVSTDASLLCAVGQGCSITTYLGSAYKTYTSPSVPVSETTTTYPKPLSSFTKSAFYTYNLSLNMVLKSETDSKGQTVQTSYNHPTEMTVLNLDPTGVYSGMISSNVTNPIIQTMKLINGIPAVTNITDYFRLLPGIDWFKPLASKIQYANNSVQTLEQYNNYDYMANLNSKAKPGGAPTSYIYGYQNLLPIAEVRNASYIPVTTGYADIIMTHGNNSSHSQNFTVNGYGQTKISLNYNGVPSGSDGATVSCQIFGPNGYTNSFVLCQSSNATCSSGAFQQILNNLPPGGYLISANFVTQTNLNTDMRIDVNYAILNNASECFYDGFEDNGTIGTAHTGLRYNSGPYTANFVAPNSRTYTLSYWYRANGTWNYQTEVYSGPHTVLPAGADAIDDVRIYPSDAQMTTYTYDPLIGMTSSTDTKGQTTYYEYDNFQRLMNIKDQYGNILKHTDYHYQNQ